MKNRIVTISLREIKSSYKRFLSLMIISMLGVAVFVGIKATAPDMMNSIDIYFDNNNIYDIKVVSPVGLTEDDVETIRQNKEVEVAEGTKTRTFEALAHDSAFVINYHNISSEINKINLIKGKLPENNNEVIVEQTLLNKENLKLGDNISISNEQGILKESELNIVGVVSSALYTTNNANNRNLGSTTLGTGQINYYVYGLSENFSNDYYSEIYLTIKGAKKLITNEDRYLDLVESVEKEINSIGKNSGWLVYDRMKDDSYYNFVNDSNSISNLSKLFPTLFYVIAVFISLVSMSRMVEDDRMEIGTLKSMGFSNGQIAFKYMFYSAIATIIGGFIGALVGFISIPAIIWNIYKILFSVPEFITKLDMTYIIVGILISFVCICGVTLITVLKNLREKPSRLLRPKTPKKGKRVLLEYIPIVWKHISFSNKVTVRNIFRYKARVFMTIFGVAGCTALLMAGFGLRDSIINIPDKQYKDVFNYDEMVYFAKDATNEEIDSLLTSSKIDKKINTFYSTFDAVKKDYSTEVTMVVPDDETNFYEIFNLCDKNTGENLKLKDNEVVISDKLADLLHISKGDEINLTDDKNVNYAFTVGGICEQYVNHYIFLNKNTYVKAMGQYSANTAFFKTNGMNIEEQKALSKKILSGDKVLQVIVIDSVIESVDDMLTSLNYVVMILIIFAAALSFVVMYNLSNINIVERQREIATLKVLGFFDGEVDNYIIKENIILTLIGIAAGLIGGYFFTNILVTTVEIERIRFIHEIKVNSYIYSAALALIFTTFVNVITHFTLKKIDMIESLKSVE